MPIVRIDCRKIKGWGSFHDVFAEAFGFPGFYGRNMAAWVDCMTSLDEPSDGMTTIHGSATDIVVLQLDHGDALARSWRIIYDTIVECAAFVNHRRIVEGEPAILALSYWYDEPKSVREIMTGSPE